MNLELVHPTQLDLTPIASRLMASLFCYDSLYLLSSLVMFSLPNLQPSLHSHPLYIHSIPVLLPLANIWLTGLPPTNPSSHNKLVKLSRLYLHHNINHFGKVYHSVSSLLQGNYRDIRIVTTLTVVRMTVSGLPQMVIKEVHPSHHSLLCFIQSTKIL